MRLSRYVLPTMLLAIAASMQADAGILKNLKEKGRGKITDVSDGLKNKGKEVFNRSTTTILGGSNGQGDNQGTKTNNVGRIVGNSQSKNATSGTNYIGTENDSPDAARLNYVPDAEELNAPDAVKHVHPSTAGADFTNVRRCFYSPKQTSSTVHLTCDETPSFSDFYDGVAYINAGNGNCFYINDRGEKLFDSFVREDDLNEMPRFYDGRTLEPTNGGKGYVIRDKSGRTVKTVNALYCSPYFVDGIATVVIGKDPVMGPFMLKYINTDGDFVFDNLSVNLSSSISDKSVLAAMAREESEGLTAVPAIDPQSGNLCWGFRNSAGSIAIKPKYHWVGDFKDGMALFLVPDAGSRTKGKWGFIDKSGREVIPASFSNRPSDFNSGYARVEARDGAVYLIDKNGNKVKGPYGRGAKDGEIDYITPFVNGRAIVRLHYEGMGAPIYALINSGFTKLGWGRLPNPNVRHEDNPLMYRDGKLFYNVENSTSRHFYWLDANDMDLMTGNVLCNPYVNGYSRFNYQGEHGYVDENFNYIIKFEKNEF